MKLIRKGILRYNSSTNDLCPSCVFYNNHILVKQLGLFSCLEYRQNKQTCLNYNDDPNLIFIWIKSVELNENIVVL